MNRAERYQLAIDLLKKAGFSWLVPPKIDPSKPANPVVRKGKGLRGPDGKLVPTITLLAPSGEYDPMRATTAIYIEQWANDIGIPIEAKLTDFNEIVDKAFIQVDFDIYMLGWGIGRVPTYFKSFWYSKEAAPQGYNTPGYNNPEFDALIDEFERADNFEQAREVIMEAQELLAEDLLDYDEFRVITPDFVPDAGGMSGQEYLLNCPPEQMIGCTFVVGEAAEARYAITGRVRMVQGIVDPALEQQPEAQDEPGAEPAASGPAAHQEASAGADFLDDDEDEFVMEGEQPATGEGEQEQEPEQEIVAEVDVYVLDVREAREALSLVVSYSSFQEANFAGGVSFVLLDVASGEIGQAVDIRMEAQRRVQEAAAHQMQVEDEEKNLSELEGEMRAVEEHARQDEEEGPVREFRPHYTLAEMEEERGAAAPWNAMGLTSRQYLNWWNSGWDISTWRRLALGRQGKIMVRAELGLGYGPTDEYYLARYALQPNTLDLKETYAFQSVDNGWGSHVGISAGYGLSPILEVEGGIARQGGTYHVQVVQEIYGVESTNRILDNPGNGMLALSAGVRVAPMPVAVARPVVGAGLLYWHGSKVTSHADLPTSPELPVFSAPNVLGARLLVGGELRVHDMIDVFLQAPLQFALLGGKADVYNEKGYYLSDKEDPSSPGFVGYAIQLGVQVRLGGEDALQQLDNDLEEIDEWEDEPEEDL